MRQFFKLILGISVISALLVIGAQAERLVSVGTTKEALNLRSGPSTGNSVITTMPAGATVLVVNDGASIADGWAKVEYNYREGYASTQWLTVEAKKDVALGNGRITGEVVNVRSAPNTSGTVVTQLKEDNIVDVLGVESGWFKIKSGDKNGFVHADYLDLTNAATTTTTNSATGSGTAQGQAVVDFAKQFLGTPYRYGGASPSGFDCSGFVYYVYKQMGKTIGRGATSQMAYGTSVSKSDLAPGDIVFFRDTRRVSSGASHSGIYVGNGNFIHSPSSGDVVRITAMSSSYYAKYYIAARRIFN